MFLLILQQCQDTNCWCDIATTTEEQFSKLLYPMNCSLQDKPTLLLPHIMPTLTDMRRISILTNFFAVQSFPCRVSWWPNWADIHQPDLPWHPKTLETSRGLQQVAPHSNWKPAISHSLCARRQGWRTEQPNYLSFWQHLGHESKVQDQHRNSQWFSPDKLMVLNLPVRIFESRTKSIEWRRLLHCAQLLGTIISAAQPKKRVHNFLLAVN